MKHWINKNYRTLIVLAFLVPIIVVAVVSISHVTQWYGVSNPLTWAVYLSVGVEIAAMSAIAAISSNLGKHVYLPFIIVTFIQFIGNIFFSYEYINIDSESFKSWVELVSPILQFGGVEATNLIAHKRILALLAGGMLPVISLSFLHMLVRFTEEQRLKEIADEENTTANTNNDTTANTNNDTNLMDEKAKIEEQDKIKLSEAEMEEVMARLNKKPKTKDEIIKSFVEKASENVIDEEDVDFEDDVDDYVENFIKERSGQVKPEIKEESWDNIRDEVLNQPEEKDSNNTTEKNSNLPDEEEKKNL